MSEKERKKKVEIKPFLLLLRTERGKNLVARVGKAYWKFWKVYGWVAVVVCFAASAFTTYYFLKVSLTTLLTRITAVPAVSLVLPEVPGVRYPFPAILEVPLPYWIVSVFILVVFHELSHAFVAVAENVRIKSLGLFVFLIFPGAFVEPDERTLEKSRLTSRLKVYAAGSFANFLVVVFVTILTIILLNLLSAYLSPAGLKIEVIPDTPAEHAGLKGDIVKVNGKDVRRIEDWVISMSNVTPGECVIIETTEGIFNVTTAPHPKNSSIPYVGFRYLGNRIIAKGSGEEVSPTTVRILEWFFGFPLLSSVKLRLGLVDWIVILNLGVGCFNLLPIKPLDGGRMWEGLLEKALGRRRSKILVNASSFVLAFLIAANLLLAAARAWLR